MQIVINIDEKYYRSIKKQGGFSTATFQGALLQAIVDGTPLPKGHDRLVEAGAVIKALFDKQTIDDVPTIIDADKENRK